MTQKQIRDKRHGQEKADLVNKVEKAEDSFKPIFTDKELVQLVKDFRQQKQWKRKDLARFLNEKEGVIADLENNKLVHDPKLAQKIRMRCKLCVS